MARFNIGSYEYVTPAEIGRQLSVQGVPYEYAGMPSFSAMPATSSGTSAPNIDEISAALTAQGVDVGDGGAVGGGVDSGSAGNGGLDMGAMGVNGLEAVGTAVGLAAANSGPSGLVGQVANAAMGTGVLGPGIAQATAGPVGMAHALGFIDDPAVNAALDVAADVGGPGNPGVGGPMGGSTGGQASPTSGGMPSSGNAGVGSGNDGAPGGSPGGASTGPTGDSAIGNEVGESGADAGGDASCVVATALVSQGLFTPAQKREWVRYCVAEKHGRSVGESQRVGYRAMFGPIAKRMKRGGRLSRVMRWVAAQYSEEITDRRRIKPIKWTLEPIAFAVGFFMGKR